MQEHSFLRNHNTDMKNAHPVKEWLKRKRAPEWVDKMEIENNKGFSQLKMIVIVFHY